MNKFGKYMNGSWILNMCITNQQTYRIAPGGTTSESMALRKKMDQASGGCSPVNWLRQTRRNVAIEFLDLNFARRKKLCKNSVFDGNMNTVVFIFFGKVFIFLRFCSFPFRKCIPLSILPDIIILRDSVPDLKISTRSVTVDTFNWLRNKFFWPQEIGGGVATG